MDCFSIFSGISFVASCCVAIFFLRPGDDEANESSGEASDQPRREKQSDQSHGKDGHATEGQRALASPKTNQDQNRLHRFSGFGPGFLGAFDGR